MSKAWNLSCTCRGDKLCPYCLELYPDNPSGRMQREIDRAHARRQQLESYSKRSRVGDFDDGFRSEPEPNGYHLTKIAKGVYGQSSKILEEVLELQDAEKQNARIMALHELSDIIGAVHGYLRENYPNMKFEDLVQMSNITRRAFESGSRK